ncbi:MAG TPA: serpin family protein [Candidatus Paceibacterota bacterium]|nr:serpin family protein [Verrucomicrobiota bacterium]HSA08903.1 serpin family protein [Candidatus Paceibacterota bacterium]
MKRSRGNALAGIIAGALIFGCSPGTPSEQSQSAAEGNNAFALDLFGQLKAEPGNLFFSPYSISTALAMTYAGARGETEKQMARVLHFAEDQRAFHAAFGQLQRELDSAGRQKGVELSIANALWAQKGYPFLRAFLRIAKDNYEASVAQADFKTAAEAARGEINRWVAQRTKYKIQDILESGSVDAVTRLVLVNAIYFKGAWAKQFDKAGTSPNPFHLTSSRRVDVPLMHHQDNVKYMENEDFQAVELPYTGGTLSMVILLPRQIEGCGQLEDRLTPALLADTLKQMREQKVEIYLPRFKLESSFKLNSTLASMGMTDAFGMQADFSGMDGTKNLFISAVFHKAWGEVNEEGTEAAAATAVVATVKSVAPRLPSFRADHPFIFFIRDTRSGSLLFLGRLADPSNGPATP